jgi:hypothetical protein
VTVTAAGVDVNVTLNRVMTLLNIRSTDAVPDEVKTILTIYAAGSKSFNPTSGLATDDNGFSLTNSINKDADGKLNIGSYAFLATDEQTIDITIEALDSNNDVLFTKVVHNVPLKRNRKTTLSGAIFTLSASDFSFRSEMGWLEENTVNF